MIGEGERPVIREAVVSNGLLKKVRATVETSQGVVELETRAFRERKLWDKLFRRILGIEGWGRFIDIKLESVVRVTK